MPRDILAVPPVPADQRVPYGDDPSQFLDLFSAKGKPRGAAAFIHGGFWRAKYDLDYIAPVCEALTEAGIATWSLEYRRIGNEGGGWPGTLEDVGAGADHLLSIGKRHNLDLRRIIAIGHSAGGHLAFWLASQLQNIRAAISLAGVLDLRRAWALKLSNNAVGEFLGGSPDDVPYRYDFASPIERLPLGKPQKLFHGTDDPSVPLEISEHYAQSAQLRGDDADLTVFPGSGHFELVDPGTNEFARVRDAALRLIL